MSDRIQIKSTGELIAALPTMLGFVPVSSIVMVFLNAGAMTFIARTDFGTGGRALTAQTIVKTNESDAVVIVAVAKGRTFREVLDECDRVSDMLLALGHMDQDLYYTPSVEGGGVDRHAHVRDRHRGRPEHDRIRRRDRSRR